MKRLIFTLSLAFFIISFLAAQEAKNEINFLKEEQQRASEQNNYTFSVTYRLQAGYLQQWQHSTTNSYPTTHLYGPEIGTAFDFNLPYNFTIQTAIMFGITYGTNIQHWKNISIDNYEKQYINHRILNYQLSIPIFATYKVKLWRELSMIFYTGPEFSVGLAQIDYIKTTLSESTIQWLNNQSIPTKQYDKYAANELFRTNVQYDLGGGLQWDKYRLVGGYKFGLNNLVKQNTDIHKQMWNWTINVTFSYAF